MDSRNKNAKWKRNRHIKERILISGELELLTPTHLGNGDEDDILDMPIMVDEITNKPLLTGTSIAGALRSYLATGFGASSDEVNKLFGSVKNKTSYQSNLIVDDLICTDFVNTEIRDGVAIDRVKRVALDKAKYDIELLEAGARFNLQFELIITERNQNLVELLANALTGLESEDGTKPAEIRLGKRKRRGFGAIKVNSWQVVRYDLTEPQGMIAYLEGEKTNDKPNSSIRHLLKLPGQLEKYNPEDFYLEAVMAIDGSLLIRSTPTLNENQSNLKKLPDAVHLRSKRRGSKDPKAIVSGTSIAGVVRSQTSRILKTLNKDNEEGNEKLLIEMFGGSQKINNKNKMLASRVWMEEAVIDEKSYKEWVHTRVMIDRFTGGAYPGALFTEQALFGKPGQKAFTIRLKLLQAKENEIGLLMLVLKDLWTGDLAIGGENSIGRGRLKGVSATIRYQGEISTIQQDGDLLKLDLDHPFEDYVEAILGN